MLFPEKETLALLGSGSEPTPAKTLLKQKSRMEYPGTFLVFVQCYGLNHVLQKDIDGILIPSICE